MVTLIKRCDHKTIWEGVGGISQWSQTVGSGQWKRLRAVGDSILCVTVDTLPPFNLSPVGFQWHLSCQWHDNDTMTVWDTVYNVLPMNSCVLIYIYTYTDIKSDHITWCINVSLKLSSIYWTYVTNKIFGLHQFDLDKAGTSQVHPNNHTQQCVGRLGDGEESVPLFLQDLCIKYLDITLTCHIRKYDMPL